MKKETFGTIEMLGKVAGFGKTYEGRIAQGSLARAAFDSIDAALAYNLPLSGGHAGSDNLR